MPSEKQIQAATVALKRALETAPFIGYEKAAHIALTAAEQAEPAPAQCKHPVWGQDKDGTRVCAKCGLVEHPAARSGAVKVKPLEWVRGWMNAEAQTDIGLYQIAYRRDGSFEWCFGIKKEWASSWDAAKAAAQADYERRILSALEPAEPATDAEPYLWLHPWNGSTSKYRSGIAVDCPKDGPQPIPLYTRPPESRLREALEEIANLKTVRDRPDDYNRGFADGRWQAVKIARAALAQGADDERE